MKILRIITRLNMGGPAFHAILLSEAIGYTVLGYGRLSKDEKDILLNKEMFNKSLFIDYHFISSLQRQINLIKDWKAFWKIRKIIKKYKPDIIHTHLAKAGFLGRLAGISVNLFQKKKIKLAHTFHGHTFHNYFPKWKTWLFIILERWFAKRSTIICLNESQRFDLSYEYSIANYDDIEIIPLGLELDKFKKLPLPISSKLLNVAIIGRLTSIKNHKMFLDAIRIIKLNGKKFFYNFYIVGGGELKCELIDYVNELGINDCVIWWGWEADIAKFYEEQNIHLVVNTSLNEGTPVSLIEAIVAGRQVICADFKGARDFIGEAGMIIPMDDPQILADKLVSFIYNDQLKKNEKYRSIFYWQYSSGRLTEDIKKLYKKLTN